MYRVPTHSDLRLMTSKHAVNMKAGGGGTVTRSFEPGPLPLVDGEGVMRAVRRVHFKRANCCTSPQRAGETHRAHSESSVRRRGLLLYLSLHIIVKL